MSAGKIEDMLPKDRYRVDRVLAIIDQSEFQFPLVKQEIRGGFLYHAGIRKEIQKIVDNPIVGYSERKIELIKGVLSK